MSSAFRRTLPARPDLEQQKKLAKELLRALPRRRPRRHRPHPRRAARQAATSSLADAQFVLAREYGFASWRELQRPHRAARRRRSVRRSSGSSTRSQRGDAAAVRALLERARRSPREPSNAPIFGFDSPALRSRVGRASSTSSTCCWSSAPIRIGAASWWAGDFTRCTCATRCGGRAAASPRARCPTPAPRRTSTASICSRAMLAEDPARVHERGGDGQTPLHFARSRAVVDLLLDAGADIDARDVDHRSTAAEWMLGDGAGVGALRARDAISSSAARRRTSSSPRRSASPTGRARCSRPILRCSVCDTAQGDYGEKPPSSHHIYQWTIGAESHAAAGGGEVRPRRDARA